MAAANLTEFVTASARNWSKKMMDNVTTNNALLNYLDSEGRIKTANGGRVIDEAIIYPTNPNTSIKWYQGYDTFNPPTSSEVLDAAEFQWKQLGAFIAISGLEKIQNSGEGKRYDYTEARLMQVDALLRNTLSAAMYSDGSVSNQIGGLKLIIADDPTAAGTVGGINQQTFTFWRNQYSAAASTDINNIQSRMNSMYLATLRGNDAINLVPCSYDMYTLYEGSLQQQLRFMSSKEADAGFENLRYKTASVIPDYNCPAKHMYFVNTKTLFVKKAPGDLLEVGSARTIQNADYDVIPIFFAGAITVNNRSLNGVIIAS